MNKYSSFIVILLIQLSIAQNATENIEDKCSPNQIENDCITGKTNPDTCCKNIKSYLKIKMADSKNCSAYFQCANNHSIHIYCPKGLHWSVLTERCEWPEEANCESNEEGSGELIEINPEIPNENIHSNDYWEAIPVRKDSSEENDSDIVDSDELFKENNSNESEEDSDEDEKKKYKKLNKKKHRN